jgi:hypothetical protein
VRQRVPESYPAQAARRPARKSGGKDAELQGPVEPAQADLSPRYKRPGRSSSSGNAGTATSVRRVARAKFSSTNTALPREPTWRTPHGPRAEEPAPK